jgi:hypothetical protein
LDGITRNLSCLGFPCGGKSVRHHQPRGVCELPWHAECCLCRSRLAVCEEVRRLCRRDVVAAQWRPRERLPQPCLGRSDGRVTLPVLKDSGGLRCCSGLRCRWFAPRARVSLLGEPPLPTDNPVQNGSDDGSRHGQCSAILFRLLALSGQSIMARPMSACDRFR